MKPIHNLIIFIDYILILVIIYLNRCLYNKSDHQFENRKRTGKYLCVLSFVLAQTYNKKDENYIIKKIRSRGKIKRRKTKKYIREDCDKGSVKVSARRG